MVSPQQFVTQDLFGVPIAEAWDWLVRCDPMRLAARPGARLEWTREQGYAALIEPPRGAVARWWGGVELEPAGNGTRLRAFVELTPRGTWALPIIPYLGTREVDRVVQACRRYERAKREGRTIEPGPTPGPFRRLLYERRLKGFVADSGGASLLPSLQKLLAGGSDEAVGDLDAFELARRWKADPDETLRLFLYAAHEGLLQYHWVARCPYCRQVPVRVPSLDRLPLLFHCSSCRADHDADLSRNTELLFSAAPAIRRAKPAPFPAPVHPRFRPTILALRPVPPGSTRGTRLMLGDQTLRMRAEGATPTCLVWPVPSLGRHVSRVALTFDGTGWTPTGHLFRPGPVKFEVTNQTGEELAFALEDAEAGTQGPSALSVLCRADFQDLFAKDAPSAGVAIRSGTLCFLATGFADPVAATEALGDSAAYCRDLRFQALVADVVRRHRGIVFRRAGDQCLSAFPRTSDGLAAALDLQRVARAFNAEQPQDPPVAFRAAVYAGPALATRCDGRLDFSGETVQLALALLAESHGGDVVFPASCLDHERVERTLAGAGAEIAVFTALRPEGTGTIRLYRAMLAGLDMPTSFRLSLRR